MHTTKEEFNRLIAAAKLESAIKYLVDASGDTEWYNEAITLSSRYEEHARKERLNIHDNAVIERNQIVYTATQLGNKVFGDTADNGGRVVVGGFNISDFIRLLASSAEWDVKTITFPAPDSSAVQDFIDHLKAPGVTSWEIAKQRGKLSLLYKYVKTLFSLSQDADLRFEVLKPIEDLLELKSYNRAPANFDDLVRNLITTAEGHITRLEGQEQQVRTNRPTESLRQHYQRLQGISVVGTKHDDWVALLQRIANENPSLAYRFTKLQSDLETLSNLTGRNLYDAIFSTGQPTVSQRIAAAIKLVEDNAELI